jgi:Mannosyl-glycoprotein endo-beta-N-acetylglucosaminidase
MNDYFYQLAINAAAKAGSPIKPEWIYAQFAHETGEFTSDMCIQYHNLGGLTQTTENDTPQPDGAYWYMQFGSFEEYADYFGRYLTFYREDGLFDSQNIEDYVTALKRGKYFGDSLENYLAGVKRVMTEEFPGVA